MRERLVALGAVWACLGFGAVAACGSDEDGASSSGSTPDASVDTAPPVPTADGSMPPGPPVIMAADETIYTGMVASIDGSATAAQTFVWTVKTAPNGSTVTTATLVGANTARPSFRADVTGDYVLTVVASNGGAQSTKDVKVKAVPAPLFFMQTNLAEKSPYFEYRTVGHDGTGGHPIACRTTADPDAGGEVGGLLVESMFLADMGEDWWEAPPTDPSRVAFVQFDFKKDDAGNSNTVTFLGLGTNNSTCQNPPAKVVFMQDTDGGTNGSGIIQPRFSRNGNRVAFLDQRNSGWYLNTVSYDGQDRRQLATMCLPDQSSGCFQPAIFPPRPQWLDDTTVGWVRNSVDDAGTTTGWEVMVATDSANPSPHLYMTCDGVQPRSFAFLKDGSVIANRQVADGGGKEDLWVLKPSSAGGPCTVVANITNLATDTSYARDFAVSPDDKEVAFVRRLETDASTDSGGVRFGGEVFTVPVAGGVAPAPVTGTPQQALFGPRYVAGATALAWNGAIIPDGGYDAGDAGAFLDGGLPVIAVASRDGGPVTYAAKSDPDAGTYTIGGGNGGSCDFRFTCAVDRTSGVGGGVWAFAIAGGLLLRRRRRRH